MGLTLKTAPGEEPVTLAEAKLHCRVEDVADNALITALITAARQQAEHRTGRALITQGFEYTLDRFPAGEIRLPKPSLVSVQTVKYLDADGTLQTLANTEYQVITGELVGRIVPAYGKAWPACRLQPDAIAINYTCGYGAAANVPASIKTWMLLAVGTWYAQREGVITVTTVAELPRDFFAALLDPYWVPGV